MLANIRRYGLEERFRLLGVVPRGQMMSLMAKARAVINPSMFEGWSTTVEESRASGKRMLLSDIPVHREQDPPDAIYFPANDAGCLAEAMLRVQSEYQPQREAERAQEAAVMHAQLVRSFARRYVDIARVVVGEANH